MSFDKWICSGQRVRSVRIEAKATTHSNGILANVGADLGVIVPKPVVSKTRFYVFILPGPSKRHVRTIAGFANEFTPGVERGRPDLASRLIASVVTQKRPVMGG